MRVLRLFLVTTAAAAAAAAKTDDDAATATNPSGQLPHLFSNPSAFDPTFQRIPTSYESAVLGRRILALTPLGTVATVFPPDGAKSGRPAPPGMGGVPHGMMEYIADCEEGTHDVGNPTLLAITIASTFVNAAAGSNVTLAVQWTPRFKPVKRIRKAGDRPDRPQILMSLVERSMRFLGVGSRHRREDAQEGKRGEQAVDPFPYSAANLPRFSLHGYVEPIPHGDDAASPVGAHLARCFVAAHPDAKFWLPGSRIHESHFYRLVVTHVYWVGGFGDRAYIGWIPVDEWRNVTRAEWEAVRLPGEKPGWKEWDMDALGGRPEEDDL